MIRALAAAVLLAVTAPIVTAPINAQAAPENHSGNSAAALYTGVSFLVRNYTHTQLNPTNSPMPGCDIGFGKPHAFAHKLG